MTITTLNNKTRFTLRKGNITTNTRSILAVAYLHGKGWKIIQSTLGELI